MARKKTLPPEQRKIRAALKAIAARQREYFDPEHHIKPIEAHCRKVFEDAGGKYNHRLELGTTGRHTTCTLWLPPNSHGRALAALRALEEIRSLRTVNDAKYLVVHALRLASYAWRDELRLGVKQKKNIAALETSRVQRFGNAADKQAQAVALFGELSPTWTGKGKSHDLDNEIGQRIVPPCCGRNVRRYLKPPAK